MWPLFPFRACACALLFASCGGDPAGPVLPPTVSGTWAYAAPELTGEFFGDPVTCQYELEMTIESSGSAFTGLYRSALMLCDLFGGEPQLVEAGGGRVVAGSLRGNQVEFDFDSRTIHNRGTWSGDRMSGQVDVQLVIQHNAQIDTILVTGPWGATR